MSTLTASTLAAQHILAEFNRIPRSKPLFVGIQGPQGSGKTHLSRSLVSLLSSPPHSLHLAVFSVDDLYLTHEGLVDLAANNPGNRLWKGRGQPGTHDVELGAYTLKKLRDLNDSSSSNIVTLPIFDKSKFNGEGDRLSEGVNIEGPVDIVILEGWCMGFYPLDNETLNKKRDAIISGSDDSLRNDLDIAQRCMEGISKRDVEQVNESLHGYVEQWYPYFEAFIQWRLQQEHDMKSKNGGVGMTDDQVVKFVDRYIPGYIFFAPGIEHGGSSQNCPPWHGRGLCITIDENRQVIKTSKF
ncbi:hypothetical protein Clacol_002683 [Clathrus columnatus]|uniref:P-loop containing nucleoside triphosphate hydrolase protein n=1 Tax=Clathrus columnatus TaxID=1419009 RepID=A0AAV5A677_9AGAM|nr:hypothetical protein Clacol_002683 [Clathrus columnatus]